MAEFWLYMWYVPTMVLMVAAIVSFRIWLNGWVMRRAEFAAWTELQARLMLREISEDYEKEHHLVGQWRGRTVAGWKEAIQDSSYGMTILSIEVDDSSTLVVEPRGVVAGMARGLALESEEFNVAKAVGDELPKLHALGRRHGFRVAGMASPGLRRAAEDGAVGEVLARLAAPGTQVKLEGGRLLLRSLHRPVSTGALLQSRLGALLDLAELLESYNEPGMADEEVGGSEEAGEASEIFVEQELVEDGRW